MILRKPCTLALAVVASALSSNAVAGCPAIPVKADLAVLDCQFYDAAADDAFKSLALDHWDRDHHSPEAIAFLRRTFDSKTGAILAGRITVSPPYEHFKSIEDAERHLSITVLTTFCLLSPCLPSATCGNFRPPI
jgi:hypothetical protein